MSTIKAACSSRPAEPEHRAVFYADELALVRAIGEFAADALKRGDAAVVLAAKWALRATGRWIRLAANAPDVDARLVLVDRDEVIERLAASSDPAAVFEALLADLCGGLPAGAEPVHIYGDLTGTLWERGDLHAALSIEDMRSRAATRTGQSILCAYAQNALTTSSDVPTIRALHTSVVPAPSVPKDPTAPKPQGREHAPTEPRTLRMIFPASIPACRAARCFVREALQGTGAEPAGVHVAELVCSELAANAVRHAGSVFTVEVTPTSGGIHVAVADEGSTGRGRDDLPVEVAHGLGIVTALSADWGVTRTSPGKVVWADLPDP